MQAWRDRNKINITENSGSLLTNFQVLIEIQGSNPAGANYVDFTKIKANGDDVRFTKANGYTLLDYWIESWNDTALTAKLWVEVNSLPASAVTSIYLYYNNAAATAASNGTNTFEFFDDFPGTSLDTTTKWTVNAGSFSVANSELSTSVGGAGEFLRSKPIFPVNSSVRMRVIAPSAAMGDNGYVGFADGTGRPNSDGSSNMANFYGYSSVTTGYFNTELADILTRTTSTYLQSRVNYNVEELIRISTTSVRILQNDVQMGVDQTTNIPTISLPVVLGRFGFQDISTKYDWVLVRKYASPEPTKTILSAEHA